MWCEYIFLNRLLRKTKDDLPTEKYIFVCLVFFFFFYEYDVKDMKGA